MVEETYSVLVRNCTFHRAIRATASRFLFGSDGPDLMSVLVSTQVKITGLRSSVFYVLQRSRMS
jgi:hypothetical protein